MVNENPDLWYIEHCGITPDYFNEFPISLKEDDLNDFFKNCAEGITGRRYSVRFKNQKLILERSDPAKVRQLDGLAEKLKQATIDKRYGKAKIVLGEILEVKAKLQDSVTN
jgi:hypothetical protein